MVVESWFVHEDIAEDRAWFFMAGTVLDCLAGALIAPA